MGPALTHVSMKYGDSGWKHVTAEEAEALFPKQSVPAGTRQFICECCGQYVSFTKDGINVRHFKHSRGEEDKTCEERVARNAECEIVQYNTYDFPLRLALDDTDFNLSIGIPQCAIKTKDTKVTVQGKREGGHEYTIRNEAASGLVWLDLNKDIANSYKIKTESRYPNWPEIIAGINPAGTFFDSYGGRRLHEGDVAVVAWHDEPNINDSTKVFCCLTPIDKEIIKVFRTKAESKEDVIEDLKKGMPFGDSDNDILYVFNTGIGRLQGILCQKGDLKVAGDKYILQPTVKSLSVYDISPSDLIVLDNIPYECRNLAYCEVLDKSSLDFPVTRAHTKSVGEIIKDIVLEEAFTWGNYSKYAKEISQQGKLTNASLHTLKNFIQHIDTSNLYERVRTELSCSYEEAKQWTNRVVNRADEYFSGEELSGDVIEALLWNSKNLREKCMNIGAEMWRQENADSIKAAQEKISELDNQCKERQTQINAAEQLIEKKKDELSALESSVKKNASLVNDIKKNVQQYISEADDDIAAFYARHKIAMGVRGDGNLSRNLFEHGEKAFHYSNTVKSYKDCLSLLENNLPYAGVSHESKHAMASVLYSAYVNKLPLLLMGPSSKEIADTLSLSVTGKYANQLQCDGPCDIGIIRESYKSTGVLVVTNAFGSDWMISLLQELNQAKCLIVFVHPFIEDISIEASSLYSYCCPISTVDTVDNLADMNGVTGACLSDSFEAYVPTVKGSKRADELMAMSASKLFVRNLAYIEGNAASISGNEADIESFVTENIIEPYKALTQN